MPKMACLSPCNERFSTRLQKNWDKFSVFIAGISFCGILSTDPDSKNPKVFKHLIFQIFECLSNDFSGHTNCSSGTKYVHTVDYGPDSW